MPSSEEVERLEDMSKDILILEVKYALLIKDLTKDINTFTVIRSKIHSVINSERIKNQED